MLFVQTYCPIKTNCAKKGFVFFSGKSGSQLRYILGNQLLVKYMYSECTKSQSSIGREANLFRTKLKKNVVF